ncbi:hypothetical protein AGMMS50233_10810 [Endomicrobiia bacterium]|nr:hypothetical protein AGMMS50233_10810 [Endomicrobiia bacterium]
MHHLGTYEIPEDAWYGYSDEEMRQIIASVCGDGHARTGEMLAVTDIVRLQIGFGINKNNAVVSSTTSYSDPNAKTVGYYKEALFVYDPEDGVGRSGGIHYEKGSFNGFDYDTCARVELGCLRYCKL